MDDLDEDDALVSRASRGDAAAVHRLLARHMPGLLGFVRKRAPDLTPAESASDVVQSACREVLTDLSKGKLEYRGEHSLRAWLYEAALFKIRNRRRYWRAERRDRRRERAQPAQPASAPELAQLARTSATPSREAVAREEQGRLAQLIEELPGRYREVLLLARIEGLPHKEIAARLEITEASSRQLLSRALARLATLGAYEARGDSGTR